MRRPPQGSHARSLPAFIFITGALALLAQAANANPPIPGPGQTVHWTLAASPHVVNATATIPVGATVIVDAGATVQVLSSRSLIVRGLFRTEGTPALPVRLEADISSFPVDPFAIHGTAELNGVILTGRVAAQSGGAVLLSDSTVDGGVIGSTEAIVGTQPQYVEVEDSTFVDASAFVVDATLVVRNSTFTNGAVSVLRGYLLGDGVDIDNGTYSYNREDPAQMGYIGSVAVRNLPTGGGLQLSGGNFFVDADVVLENDQYPVALAGGLHPDSTLPLTGNVNNAILNDDFGMSFTGVVGRATWPNLGLPYVIEAFFNTSGDLEIGPGVVVRFAPAFGMQVAGTRDVRILGTPSAPVRLTSRHPTARWDGVIFAACSVPPRVESTIIERANFALSVDDCELTLADSILRDNNVGSSSTTFGRTLIRKTRILDNGIGAQGSDAPVSNGEPHLNSRTMPNAIEGNGIGVLAQADDIDARNNWWGSPTGPTAPGNPGGTGDSVQGPVLYSPFRTARPNFNDHPPVVRVDRAYPYIESGEKMLLTWDASDAGGITTQRVIFYGSFGSPPQIIASNLPPTQRSLEVTVPLAPGSNGRSILRVEAFDARGQSGWDQTYFTVPWLEDWSGGVVPDAALSGIVLTPGERIDLCTDGGRVFDALLLLDGDSEKIELGGTTTDCIPTGLTAPYSSTDTARVAYIYTFGAGGRSRWFFSDYFSSRPDVRIDDAPPQIELTSPPAGAVFVGGGTVPVRWTASDDTGLRAFDVQASLSGGLAWHTVVADLPGTATSYDWTLPASAGVDDLRVRVVARDLRFQNSSDGGDGSLSILPGAEGVPGCFRCPAPAIARAGRSADGVAPGVRSPDHKGPKKRSPCGHSLGTPSRLKPLLAETRRRAPFRRQGER